MHGNAQTANKKQVVLFAVKPNTEIKEIQSRAQSSPAPRSAVEEPENSGLGLERNPTYRRPRAAFSSPPSQFFTIRTDPKPANNIFSFFPAVNWLTSGFVCATFYKPFAKIQTSERASNSDTTQRKMYKEQIYFAELLYVSCI